MDYAMRVAVIGLIGACCASAAVRAEPVESKCMPVPIAATHPLPRAGASPFLTTQRLARIEYDTVACLDRLTLDAQVSGARQGRYAIADRVAAGHVGAGGQLIRPAAARRAARAARMGPFPSLRGQRR